MTRRVLVSPSLEPALQQLVARRLKAWRLQAAAPRAEGAVGTSPALLAEVAQLGGQSMGTDWRVRWVADAGPSPAECHAIIQAALDGVVASMSHWDPASDLSRLRAAAVGEWVSLPVDLLRVLQRAIELAEVSGGAFDPTVGRLVAMQGYGPVAEPEEPDAEVFAQYFAAAQACCDWRALEVDLVGSRARHHGANWIDLSGIAKGFAVDCVGEALVARGVDSCLVEIGGECRGWGCKPDGQPWWVALEPLARQLGGVPTVAALSDLALATSGVAAQSRTTPAGRRQHLVDPRAGRELAAETLGVSVFAPTCLDADAWATALFVLGESAGLALAEEQQLAAAWTCQMADGGTCEVSSTVWKAMESV